MKFPIIEIRTEMLGHLIDRVGWVMSSDSNAFQFFSTTNEGHPYEVRNLIYKSIRRIYHLADDGRHEITIDELKKLLEVK